MKGNNNWSCPEYSIGITNQFFGCSNIWNMSHRIIRRQAATPPPLPLCLESRAGGMPDTLAIEWYIHTNVYIVLSPLIRGLQVSTKRLFVIPKSYFDNIAEFNYFLGSHTKALTLKLYKTIERVRTFGTRIITRAFLSPVVKYLCMQGARKAITHAHELHAYPHRVLTWLALQYIENNTY